MSNTLTLGLLIKTAVSGAGYGVFAELGRNIDRLKAKTRQASETQVALGRKIEVMRQQGHSIDVATAAYHRLGHAI